jgi:imidazole glycerol-phosphate synthase subunit HisF
MLKTRILPTLLFKDSGLVKGKQFLSDRPVGSALQAIKVYNRREVDELVFLDVSASLQGRPPDFAQIDELADECFMPMTVGGGVSKVEHIRGLLAVGADKICIGSAAFSNPEIISEGARVYGRQCIVAAIDVRREGGGWRVYSHCGTRATDLDPVAWAREVEALGAGEIVLTSIDRDGTMSGYDVEITRLVTTAVSIPVIASGGAGEFSHMAEVLETGGASAAAAASIFHFTERTPREAKAFLKARGFAMRL